MIAEENPEVPESHRPELRAYPRFAVDEDALLLVVNHDSRHSCRVVNLSLEGCRIQTRELFRAGIQKRVEISFKINGIAFRMSGTTQWTDGRNAVGIHFVYPTRRRRDELAEVLSEVEADLAAKAEKEVAEELARLVAAVAAEAEVAQTTATLPVIAEAPAGCSSTQSALLTEQPQAKHETPLLEVALPSAVQPSKRERRAFSRQDVDTRADILLINIGCAVHGRIQDLSLGGCRIRTDESFPVGIYTRVETEFCLEGLPFRLGGVVQGIHERNLVGIRFLDMSIRKREQVEQLIGEIEMQHASHRATMKDDSGESEGL
jgi:PilZ domain